MIRFQLNARIVPLCLIGLCFFGGCGHMGSMRSPPKPFDLGGDELRIPEARTNPSRWLDSWEIATTQAKREDKVVVACFTGSDWCSWCKRLETEVFDTPEFDEWAMKKAILLKLDFPRHSRIDPAVKMQNEELAKRYTDHIGGYPTVLILTPDGTVIGEMGYVAGGPTAWINQASRFMTPGKTNAGE